MAQRMIGADVDALDGLVVQMRSAADELDQHESGLTSLLRGVPWVGDFASHFIDLWSSSRRVQLQSSASFIRDAADSLARNAAEQRSASETGGVIGAGPGVAGGPGANDTGSDGATPPTVSPDDIFDDDYMRNFIDIEIEGANDPGLNEAMEQLMNEDDPARIDELLDEIAEIRGVGRADLEASYDRYVELRDELLADGHVFEDISDGRWSDFMGSTWSLRYGKVAGAALGIDPVFAAMLNPTGGIVGPGSSGIVTGSDGALGYHGTFHDAAGYLYNHHDLGPGYSYIPGDNGDPSNPYKGQVDGILYWTKAVAQDHWHDASGWAQDRIDDGIDWAADRGSDLVDGTKGLIDKGLGLLP